LMKRCLQAYIRLMGTKEEAQIKYAVGWNYNHLTTQM
jgi:hypothetical protein